MLEQIQSRKKRRNPLWLITSFLLLVPIISTTAQSAAHGTAEFIIRTPNEIVAAADSRAMNGDGSTDPNPDCKIRSFDNVFVAVYGMSQERGFDIFSILNTVRSERLWLDPKIVRFEAVTKIQLEKALDSIKRDRPVAYQHAVAHPPGVVFFGLEHGELFLHSSKFVVGPPFEKVIVNVESRQCPGTDCPKGVAIVHAEPDKSDEYYQRLEREFPGFKSADLSNLAKRFVQMQIDDHVREVGSPIDVLRITKNGAVWTQRKPECEEAKKERPTKRVHRLTRHRRNRIHTLDHHTNLVPSTISDRTVL